jgi:(R,R)-butanediol dehydrogenase / meso-butanediol dehydrogenase / diacetyl reductase
MKAVVWHGREDVRVEEVEDAPPPGPGEVRLAIAWTGICGSDVHEFHAGPILIPAEPHPTTGVCAPLILGHEAAGYVESVGAGVEGFAEGDLVVPDALLPCGACDQCAEGSVNRCRALGHLGMSAHGTFADFVTVPAGMLLRRPDESRIGADALALVEPLAVAVRCVDRAALQPGETVLVLGGGAIGLATALVARVGGADVIVCDRAAEALDHARRLGFEVVTPEEMEVVQPAVVFECTGAPVGPSLAAAAARPGGRVILVGLPAELAQVDWTAIVLREVGFASSVGHIVGSDTKRAFDLVVDEEVPALDLVTRKVGLDEAVENGLAVLAGPEAATQTKILLKVG